MPRRRKGQRCANCGVNTLEAREVFMVKDDVWNLVDGFVPDGVGDPANLDGAHFRCVGCMEKRLGRRLVPDDFSRCPLNDGTFLNGKPAPYHDPRVAFSERLRDRMGK